MEIYKDIIVGDKKIYEHETYYLRDKKGNVCEIRCSFDKDRFLLRSARMVNEIIHEYPCELKFSVIGKESVEN